MSLQLDLLGGPPVGTDIQREASIRGNCRWHLLRRWAQGPTLLVVMLNPSTADAERDDPTMLRVMHFARSWGYGACVVVNLYPWITPNPDECRQWANAAIGGGGHHDHLLHTELMANLHFVYEQSVQADAVLLAYGNTWDGEWAARVVGEIDIARGCQLICLGRTQSGNPIHPLARGKHRVPDDAQPQLWEAAV